MQLCGPQLPCSSAVLFVLQCSLHVASLSLCFGLFTALKDIIVLVLRLHMCLDGRCHGLERQTRYVRPGITDVPPSSNKPSSTTSMSDSQKGHGRSPQSGMDRKPPAMAKTLDSSRGRQAPVMYADHGACLQRQDQRPGASASPLTTSSHNLFSCPMAHGDSVPGGAGQSDNDD